MMDQVLNVIFHICFHRWYIGGNIIELKWFHSFYWLLHCSKDIFFWLCYFIIAAGNYDILPNIIKRTLEGVLTYFLLLDCLEVDLNICRLLCGTREEVLWRGCEGVARQQGGQLGVMSTGLKSCLLSVPGPDKNRQAGLGRPAWSCHHGHLLIAIITSSPASHRYSIQTQLRALHVPLQPAITNTPESLTRLPFFPLANL